MPLTRATDIRRSTQAIVHRVGHRGVSLLFFALLDAVYAFSLFAPLPDARLSAQLALIQRVAPLPVWGSLWAAAGAACLVCAFRTNDRWGFTAAMLIKVAWGALYVYGTFLSVERAWLGAVIWLCLAGWVGIISSWPEPPDLGE